MFGSKAGGVIPDILAAVAYLCTMRYTMRENPFTAADVSRPRESSMRTSDLLDIGQHPEFYADDIADVWFTQTTVRYIFFEWKKLDGVLRRCISGEVIRAISSITPDRISSLRKRFPVESENQGLMQ